MSIFTYLFTSALSDYQNAFSIFCEVFNSIEEVTLSIVRECLIFGKSVSWQERPVFKISASLLIYSLRACSHEPGTVNYPGIMIAPGQALPRVRHMMICCPGEASTSLPWGKFIFIWSLRIDLNSCIFYTNCYRELILNTFTYFWCFLELFIEKFIPNINNEHAQDYYCPGVTFAFCSHGEKLPRQGGLPGVLQRVTCRLSKSPWGNEKLTWTVPGARPSTEAESYQSLYGLKTYDLSETTNFLIRAFQLSTSCQAIWCNLKV